MKTFEFKGSGLGYLWLLVWTTIASTITFGLFFPWAYSAQQRWICSNTYCEGRQMKFIGSGMGFFIQWVIIVILTMITFGIYIPWGYTKFKRWETANTVFAGELIIEEINTTKDESFSTKEDTKESLEEN